MWEDVAFTVMGTGTSGSSQPGFSMSPDEAKKTLAGLIQVRDSLNEMHYTVTTLCAMKAPSQDPATAAMHHARVGDGSKLGAFSYGGGHIDLQLGYVNELIDRISKALHITVNNDSEQRGRFEGMGA